MGASAQLGRCAGAQGQQGCVLQRCVQQRCVQHRCVLQVPRCLVGMPSCPPGVPRCAQVCRGVPRCASVCVQGSVFARCARQGAQVSRCAGVQVFRCPGGYLTRFDSIDEEFPITGRSSDAVEKLAKIQYFETRILIMNISFHCP